MSMRGEKHCGNVEEADYVGLDVRKTSREEASAGDLLTPNIHQHSKHSRSSRGLGAQGGMLRSRQGRNPCSASTEPSSLVTDVRGSTLPPVTWPGSLLEPW